MVERRRYLELCAAGSSLALAGCLSGVGPLGGPESEPEKIDDWQYDPDESGLVPSTHPSPNMSGGTRSVTADAAMESSESIGLAAGGAADVGTFRRNVYEGYLPIPETMAYEGLFHDYYFDTGGDGSCTSLFCPTYTPAVTDDPLSGETERYLSVGLDSGLAASEFERPPLNLVIVLDISGSMSASFDEYYYDKFGNEQRVEGETERPKIEVATDVLADLTEQLRPEDRLGVVLFNNDAEVAKPLRDVERTDMDAIRDHIREDIQAGGGTNISAGMDEAESLLDEVVEEGSEYENRSILLTDAQINRGETDGGELQSTLEARAEKRMHTSVIGIGVDFNAELIDQLTAVRGANYYSVYSADQFEQRLVEEFEYMVTPLVYDLSLELNAEGYDIKQVYGSTAAEEATGELMYVNTLFPSPSEGGKAKGGVVLVEIEGTGTSDGEIELVASWERRSGLSESTTEQISFPDEKQWGNTAIRKAVLLARYADLLKEWTVTERSLPEEEVYPERSESDEMGVEPPAADLTRWELQSERLRLSPETADRLAQFRRHFEREADAIGDEDLDRELELLDEILAAER
jgi:Ca-activated chloride channel family protein